VTLQVVYEAGPTGYVVPTAPAIKAQLHRRGSVQTPVRKGRAQKTDRRDALMLARLHRAGELTGIHVPDAVDDGVRSTEKAQS
jgi:transposase